MLESMLETWKVALNDLSGNLTTNEYMPLDIKALLFAEDISLKDKIFFEEVAMPSLEGIAGEIKGLNIIAGLQNIIKEDDFLTVFRAVRFPTYKRIYDMIYNKGCAIANYEQERILQLYRNQDYISRRDKIKKHRNFWTQPQERVVSGLPVFCLVNDAIQIHRAFRNKKDKVAVIAIHIPFNFITDRKIKLIANTAIDLDYDNRERDFEIQEFEKHLINFKALRARGIDLHEMYIKGLPWSLEECEALGIRQDFFLLNIYEIESKEKINALKHNAEALIDNEYFLHGFFGDQNIFGRRESKYLPEKCWKIERKGEK